MTELPHGPIAVHDPVDCHACAVLMLRGLERVLMHQTNTIKALEARAGGYTKGVQG